MKYQTWEAVSINKNWNPAGLMTGLLPGVSLKKNNLQQKMHHKLLLIVVWLKYTCKVIWLVSKSVWDFKEYIQLSLHVDFSQSTIFLKDFPDWALYRYRQPGWFQMYWESGAPGLTDVWYHITVIRRLIIDITRLITVI